LSELEHYTIMLLCDKNGHVEIPSVVDVGCFLNCLYRLIFCFMHCSIM